MPKIPSIKFLKNPKFDNLFAQLRFEEYLLRRTEINWYHIFTNLHIKYDAKLLITRCLVTKGPVSPTIVLGLSGKIEKLVDIREAARCSFFFSIVSK